MRPPVHYLMIQRSKSINTHALLSVKASQVVPVSIAQVTDMHVFASETQRLLGVETLPSLCEAIGCIQSKTELDLLLLTGNISGDGSDASYDMVHHLIAPLRIPTYWVPGNCDRVIAMVDNLSTGLFSQRKVFERGGWNFILLDSSVPNCRGGFLPTNTLEWLDLNLAKTAPRPTLIALHHSPVEVGSDWLDATCLENSQDLFAVLDRYSHVKIVLFGHIHQEYCHHRQGVDYLGTPSTCIQYQPHSPNLKIDNQFPGLRILHLYPNGTWTTQIERLQFFPNLKIAAIG